MRFISLQTILLLITGYSFAQTQFRFGLTANPILSWMKAESPEIEKGNIRGGFEYGLMTEINFTENYILATGLTVTIAGGNLVYSDSILNGKLDGDANAKFKFQYLNIPLVFKMRTNQLGNFKYYGGLGLIPAFRFKARLDAEVNDSVIFENKNIVKRKDQTEGTFQSVVFNLSLHVEGGLEFPFGEKTALTAGIFYRNGFVNILKDGDEDKISINNLGLRIGVIF